MVIIKLLNKSIFIAILLVVSFLKLNSQTVLTYSTTGLQTWVCPVGATSATIECWGAGGGGAGVAAAILGTSGGGGGGAFVSSVITLVPGTTYSIFVGAGGAGGASGTNGANGAASSFNSNLVLADGGKGGASNGGGNGGGSGPSIGNIKFSGGNGAVGGGGSSAGKTSNGNNASGNTGGAAPSGGAAGANAPSSLINSSGNSGLYAGGGGSGASSLLSGTGYFGGNGANGKVVITYVCTPPTVSAVCNPTFVCPGATSTVSATSNLFMDQNSITGTTTGFWMIIAGQQTFVPAVSGVLKKVRIQTATYASSTNVTVNIYSGVVGSGILQSNVVYFKASNTNSWDDVILPGSGVTLAAGSPYYIEIGASTQVDWIYSSSNPYANGMSWRGGTSYPSNDYNFETYIDANSYLWNPGSITVPSFTTSPSSTTNYTVTVTNPAGCSTTQLVVVNVAPTLTASLSYTNVSCFGGNNGAINLTPTGGTTPYTFNWGGGVTTEDRTGLIAGAYTCTITDVNTCSITTSGTVTQPLSALSATTTVSNVTCFGGNNGAINLTPSGGTTPYTFNWSGGVTTEDRTGLIAGAYTCTITDVNTCTITTSTTVTQPLSALSATTIVTNVSCFGGNNGAINLTPSGGTTPYTFNWGGGVTTEDRTGLVSGVYTCSVTDANGCLTTITSTVTQPTSALLATTIATNVSCFGGNNGAINLTPLGGTAPYTFNWGGGVTTEDRTGLVAGVYTCTITDANSCVSIKTTTITQPAAILAGSTVVTNVSCFGGNNGAINLTPTGGTTPYTFNWGGGITTEDRTGLIAGAYTCTITDVNTCSVSVSATVTQPVSLLTGSTVVTNVPCFSGNNGAINLTPSGGTTPYTFNWGGGITTEDRTGLVAGAYTCTITDVNTCSVSVSATVTQPASLLTGSTVITNVSCFGGNNGAINLTPSGGTTPYTFNWGGGITTEDRTGLVAGAYTCTITDVNTCSVSVSATVTEPTVLTANAVVSTSINCNGGTGIVTVNASGGTPGYSGTGTYTVVAGTYTYTVNDINGCVKTTTINVTQPASLSITVSSSSSSICVGSTASLSATGASTYTWNPGLLSGNTVTVNPTATTVYTATGTSSLGCVATKTINLIVNSNPTVTATASSSVICLGSSSTLSGSGATSYTWNPGVITSSNTVVSPTVTTNYTLTGVNASGCSNTKTLAITVNPNPTVSIVASPSVICIGATSTLTASGAVTYLWNTSATSASITTTPTVTTMYTVTGTNAVGCSQTQTLNLVVNSLPTLTVSSSSASICNGSSVTLTGVGASSYTWNPGNLTNSVVNVSPNTTTDYTLTGMNANGCISSETINITVNQNPTVIATSSSSAICVGETATLTATGANTYSWSSGSINATEIISPSASSVYTVVGTDVLGCINSATVSLIVNSLPVITINPASTVVCSGSSVTYTVSGADTYTWSTNETTSIINVIANTPSGYTVTGTDALGCVNTGTVSLSVNTLPILSLTASPSSVCAGNSSTLTASGANTYIWNTGSSSASLIDNPTITTIYTVTGTDVNGCVSTETINLTVNALPTLTVTKSSNAVCVGHSATLTAVGANTYSWSTGAITASEVVTPTVTTIYTVTGTDAIGCSSSDTVKIIANLLPNLLTNVNTNTICLGGIVVFSNSGANTFTLSPSSLTGSVISVPINTLGVTIYTVSGTGPLGCLNTKTVSITANALPNVSITPTSATICSGQSVTLNAIGANTYTWSGTGTISNSITVSPSSNTTYSLLGTDINGCENSASSIVNVSNTPTISVSSASTNICMGYTMTMTANGASAYNWSTGATTNTINVQPFFNTTYSVVGTNGGLCSDTAIVSLTVLPLPSVTATANTTLACSGQTINLTASGNAVTYYWQPGGLLGANQNLQITSPTTYTAYGQGTNGCVFFNTLFVDVQNGTAVIPVSTPSIVCVGDSAVLSVIGGSVPSWTLNSVPNTAIVTPTVNTSYTVNAVDFNGCASDIVFTVDINADCDVVVYNGFTPNGDGINDFWIIDNIERYPNNKVYVFNRWGNKLFNTVNYNNVDNKWDGKVNGQAVSAGTYFYILVDDTEKLLKKGWIEITN